MASRKAKRIARENVAGPGTGEPGKNHRVDAILFVDGRGRANDGRVRRRGGGIIAAGHVDVDVAETFFREMRFEQGEGFGSGHVWNEAKIELGNGFAGKNGLAARAGVAADESFDIDRGAGDEQLEGFLETDVVNPV